MSEVSAPTKNEPMTKTAWKAHLKGLATSVTDVMGEVFKVQVSLTEVTCKAGAVLATAKASFVAQGLTEDFIDWATGATGKSGSWVNNAIRAADVRSSLPESRGTVTVDQLAALQRVGSHETREEILREVLDKRKLSSGAALKAIRESADEYLAAKNPERDTRKKERAAKQDEAKAKAMRDDLRPRLARILKRAVEKGVPMDLAASILIAGIELGETHGKGVQLAARIVLKEKDSPKASEVIEDQEPSNSDLDAIEAEKVAA